MRPPAPLALSKQTMKPSRVNQRDPDYIEAQLRRSEPLTYPQIAVLASTSHEHVRNVIDRVKAKLRRMITGDAPLGSLIAEATNLRFEGKEAICDYTVYFDDGVDRHDGQINGYCDTDPWLCAWNAVVNELESRWEFKKLLAEINVYESNPTNDVMRVAM